MIHSLAGGDLSQLSINDFAKVELLEGDQVGCIYWYITQIPELKVNDLVLVPFGIRDVLIKAKVIKIERNLSNQVAPIPLKKAKKIYKIV